MIEECSRPKCDRPIKNKQFKLCSAHDWRRKNGRDMDAPLRDWKPGTPRPWPERFWEKVDRRGDDECWPWLAYINDGGYGNIMIDGRPHRAHRVAYELLIGPIPEKLVTDHLCRNRWCVNPWHLEPVTNEENIDRGLFHKVKPEPKTHCKHGHEFTPENTRLATKSTS